MLWWCDQKVDGRSVTVQYQLNGAFPGTGTVTTGPAPSHACSTVRWPDWSEAQRFRICVAGEGCSGWVEHP
jgi:hypothetical protein